MSPSERRPTHHCLAGGQKKSDGRIKNYLSNTGSWRHRLSFHSGSLLSNADSTRVASINKTPDRFCMEICWRWFLKGKVRKTQNGLPGESKIFLIFIWIVNIFSCFIFQKIFLTGFVILRNKNFLVDFRFLILLLFMSSKILHYPLKYLLQVMQTPAHKV